MLLQILFDRIASDLDVCNRFSQNSDVVGVVIDDDSDLVMRCEKSALFEIDVATSNVFRRSVIGNLFFVQLKSSSRVLKRGRE